MATISYQHEAISSKQSGPGGLIAFCLLLLIVSILSAIVLNSHAFDRHGDQAWEVRNCISGGGTIDTWINPDTSRLAHICQIESNRFGIQIEKAGREITSFVKNKLKNLEQIHRYLANQGYRPLH